MDPQWEKLQGVFRDVFDDDELEINAQTTAADVEGWDSLAHVTLMINVEKRFGVKFRSSEVARLKRVGELMELINDQLAVRG
ncbi:MAG TPA: acyl carrier protein [Pirellulales bacterium]|nr:acyl carrier protein [Pirellulales bacterium]